jgi:AcrR family transcriptional regulator
MSTTRAYRGVPADERRAVRRAALVDAALDCLHDGGLSSVGVRAVCARAKLTQRYFYENFADLDELLVAAVDSASDEVARRTLAAVAAAGSDTEAQVRAAVAGGYGVVADDPRAASAFLAAAGGHGAMRERRHEIVERYADLVLAHLDLLSSRGLRERTRARATALFLMGGTVDVIEAVLSGRVSMTRAQVVDLLSDLWLGALGTASAGPGTASA